MPKTEQEDADNIASTHDLSRYKTRHLRSLARMVKRLFDRTDTLGTRITNLRDAAITLRDNVRALKDTVLALSDDVTALREDVDELQEPVIPPVE